MTETDLLVSSSSSITGMTEVTLSHRKLEVIVLGLLGLKGPVQQNAMFLVAGQLQERLHIAVLHQRFLPEINVNQHSRHGLKI